MKPLRNFTSNIPGLICLRRAPVREFRNLPPLRRLSKRDMSKRASTRRHSTTASLEFDLEKFQYETLAVCKAVSPSVVALLSYFPGPKTKEIPHSARRGTGFFVAPTLIVTSARVVGRVSTVYDTDRSSVLHNCFLARTIALTGEEKVFCTRPVAVNFASDVAVLAVANSVADFGSPLMGIVRHGNATAFTYTLPGFHGRRLKSVRPKAPWPLDDEVEWIDYGAGETTDTVVVSLFDVYVALGSISERRWSELHPGRRRRTTVTLIVTRCIRLMVNYAKSKGPEDPIIVDRSVAEDSTDVTMECIPMWPRNIIVQMYK